jgi:site-specific DNA recombinase
MSRAVIYVRVSSREQAESGYSLDAQIEACRRFVAEQGWTTVGEYVDAGESAKTADRPNFQNMLTQLDADRGIHYVVVHKIDRFARNLDDHVAIRARFKKWGVRLVSASEGFEDTPTGRMLEGIVASISGWYSENLGVEVKKGMYQKLRSGGWPTFAPIGYKNVRIDGSRKAESKLVVDDETAHLIREAFDLYVTGEWSLRKLHAEMTRRGLRTPKGKPFSVSKLAETLQHDVYAGMVTWGGETHQGIHEPLVSMETFVKVQKVFRTHDKAGPRIGVHTTELNGCLVCATCGSKLSVTLAKGGRFAYFFCQGRARQGKPCREHYVPVAAIQRQVEDMYRQISLADDARQRIAVDLEREVELQEGGRAKEATRIARRFAQLEIERTKLLRAYYDDAISPDLLKAEQRRIDTELAEMKARVNVGKTGLEKARKLADEALRFLDNCREAYQDAEDDLRRLWNRAIFKAIYVGDGLVKGFEYQEPFGALLGYADSSSKTVRSGSP